MMEHSLFARLFAPDPATLVRFPAIPVDLALEQSAGLDASVQALTESLAKANSHSDDEATASMISRLSLHIWRARARIIDPATGEVREEMQKIHRHVEGALETLTQSGVRLDDWLGRPYDVGLPVKVLSYQPAPGISQDTIIETVRPAVLWKGRMLQMGEVIVGTPIAKES